MRLALPALLLAAAALAACSTAPKPRTEVTERKDRAAQYAKAGNARYRLADYAQARTLFTLALNENIAVDYEEGIAASCNSLGKVHLALGELEAAERYFLEAGRLAKAGGFTRLEAQSSSNLGELFLERGQAQRAEQHLLEALALLPPGDTGEEAAVINHNLGAVLKKQERLPEAMAYFQKALEMNLGQERWEEAASNCYMIASIRSRLGDTDAAVAALNEALAFDRRMENSLGIAKDLAALGSLFRRQGNAPAALESYRKSLQVYQTLSLGAEVKRLLPVLIELAEQAGLPGEAQAYRGLGE